jgi:predicted transcriptional regulator with HTH domain
VYREDRLKRIRAIRSGIIPRPSTLQKYNITPTEVNQEREEAGLKKLQEEEIEPYPIELAKTLAMEINRRTKEDLIKKAEQAYLKLKENRKELTKTQEETKEKYKGQIVDVPRESLFEISQIMDHFVQYSRRKPPGEPLSEARILHYGIKMVYSDTNMDKNTKVKSDSFNGKGQIVGILNDINKKYLKDLSLLLEPGAVEKIITDLKGLKKFKANTQQQKIELMNTLLKEYPGFNYNDEISRKRDVAVKIIDDAIVHQFTQLR